MLKVIRYVGIYHPVFSEASLTPEPLPCLAHRYNEGEVRDHPGARSRKQLTSEVQPPLSNSSSSSDDSESAGAANGLAAAGARGGQAVLLPYVRGVPRAVVAAVAAGELG